MNTQAENVATGVAVFAAITTLITAASPHWLPSQDLPPPLVYADALGALLEFTLDCMLRLCQWLETSLGAATTAALDQFFATLNPAVG